MSHVNQGVTLKRILPDLLAFAIGIGIARTLGWETTDLVWSLWLCSLVLGYLTILSTITGGVYIGIKAIFHKEFPKKHRLAAILAGAAVALFLLGFFSFHFCAFHSGHAGFLSEFFPVAGLPEHAFFDAFMNPVLLWKIVFQHLLTVYGIFLIPMIIAERKYVFASVIKSISAVKDNFHKKKIQNFIQAGEGRKKILQDPFSRPYINVIRMHILIFFFAFCRFLQIESFIIYVVVYAVYFFPWKAFKNDNMHTKGALAQSSLK